MDNCPIYAIRVCICTLDRSIHNGQQQSKLEPGQSIIRPELAVAVADDDILVGKIHDAVIMPIVRLNIGENSSRTAGLHILVYHHLCGFKEGSVFRHIVCRLKFRFYILWQQAMQSCGPGVPEIFTFFWLVDPCAFTVICTCIPYRGSQFCTRHLTAQLPLCGFKGHTLAHGKIHPGEILLRAGLEFCHAGPQAAAHEIEHSVGQHGELGFAHRVVFCQIAIRFAADDVLVIQVLDSACAARHRQFEHIHQHFTGRAAGKWRGTAQSYLGRCPACA